MKILKKVLYIFALLMFLIFFLGPIFWTFIISITPDANVLEKTNKFLPDTYTFKNYIKLLSLDTAQSKLFFLGVKNSIKASALTLILTVPSAFLSAFALARINFRGRIFIKNTLLLTMAIPVMATIIPIYKLFISLKLMNNLFALCLVYLTAYIPLVVWLMSGYFNNIPKELDEAAKVDGANLGQIFRYIIIPISSPILATVSLIIFLGVWSQFQIPLILASNINTKPIAIVNSEFVTKDTIHYGLTAAAGMLAIIPPSLVAIFFRKFLVSGMMKGSVKS